MDKFWTVEDERQRLINELHLNSPGDEDYEATLKALKTVDEIVPKTDKKIHWNKIWEAVIPIAAGIGLTALFEQFGMIFTSKSTWFWKK